MKRKNSDASDDLRPGDINGNGTKSSRWTNDEVLLVVQGIKKYGKDFQAIAETIGTKSAGQVRLFFTNHKRKYDLDGAMKEYYKQQQLMTEELGNGQTKLPITISDDIMEVRKVGYESISIVLICVFNCRSIWTMKTQMTVPSLRKQTRL